MPDLLKDLTPEQKSLADKRMPIFQEALLAAIMQQLATMSEEGFKNLIHDLGVEKGNPIRMADRLLSLEEQVRLLSDSYHRRHATYRRR